MDKIGYNFVLEFIKEIQKLLEKIEKDYGRATNLNRTTIKNKRTESYSKTIEELYNKYKTTLELEIESGDGISNLLFRNDENHVIRIPESFLLAKKFTELKEGFDNYIHLSEFGIISWDTLIDIFFKLFSFQDEKKAFININTLEKLRFFITFMNKYPEFNFEGFPTDSLLKLYEPYYSQWETPRSYAFNYKNYIKNDKYFFSRHLFINLMPDYKIWNLSLAFLDDINLLESNNDLEFTYFPLQIFVNKDRTVNSMLVLLPATYRSSELNNSLIQKFSILNNFNLIKNNNNQTSSLKLKQNLIFDSYVAYLDDLKTKGVNTVNEGIYEYTIDFKKLIPTSNFVQKALNKDTIKNFNLIRFKEKSNLYQSYDSNEIENPYRVMFKKRFSFPDFNTSNNFLLFIKKKRNSQFTKIISFLKIWSYQNIFYETKDKIIFYGFLLPNFDYLKEIIYINEIFEDANINFKFLVNGYDFNQSTLSIYNLPNSAQFMENELNWNFYKIKFPMSIEEKNSFLLSQLEKEKN